MAASFGECLTRGYHRLLTYYVKTEEEKMRPPEIRSITMIQAEARSVDDRTASWTVVGANLKTDVLIRGNGGQENCTIGPPLKRLT
jgi:hypothetical protein